LGFGVRNAAIVFGVGSRGGAENAEIFFLLVQRAAKALNGLIQPNLRDLRTSA